MTNFSAKLALRMLENQMDKTTVQKYEERFDEKYNIKDDPLYNAWSNLKQQALSDSAALKESDPSTPLPEFKSLKISPAFDEIL